MNPVNGIVCNLLETPFSRWKDEDKGDVLRQARPTYILTTMAKKEIKKSEFHIKPISCKNQITGEKGICVLDAFRCYVVNGVHIATCIHRYYIGSCCKFHVFTNDGLKLSKVLSSMSTELFFQPTVQTEASSVTPLLKKIPKNGKSLQVSKTSKLNGKFHIQKTVKVDVSHDHRQPVVPEDSHDERKPVAQEITHDLRKPVAIERSHNMRFPISAHISQNESEIIAERKHRREFHDTDCGISKTYTMARIVGGFQSNYLKWPWMISLSLFEENTYRHKCGAVLLNHLWIISVAHCVHRKKPNDIILRLGAYDLHNANKLQPYIDIRVNRIILHPEFNYLSYENDIALLRLYDLVPFNENISPVCLPQFSDDMQGRIGIVTGWGKLNEGGELPRYLHEAHLPILSNKECEEMYAEAGYFEAIPDTFMCAGFYSGGVDACEGDSGGPMIINEKGRWSLIGLISWGIGCAAPKQPGVYTRITKYVEWIKNTITY